MNRRTMPGAVKNIGNYLTKVTLWGPIRLHIFWRGDADPQCHDHPNDFWTFPLIPYVEEFIGTNGYTYYRVVKAFRLHFRRAEFAHRVIGPFEGYSERFVPLVGDRPIVTLLWWSKPRREWGFHTPNGWVHWREWTKETVD